mgnify:CR=1 FL=1
MPDMKGITVKIPADLHAEVKAYLEAHGMTMGEFIAQAVDHELHPKLEQEDKSMERMRTLAFQVPDSLFQRVKAYLERNHMTQKQFVIGLIESEIEQDEAQYQASHPEEQEDEEESDDQAQDEETEQETQDEFTPQEAQDGRESQLEKQAAADQDDSPVDNFEAGSEEVSQEDDGAEEPGEKETQEDEEVFEDEDIEESDAVEELEDDEFEEAQENEEAWGESNDQEGFQDEEEEQSYQPSMAW